MAPCSRNYCVRSTTSSICFGEPSSRPTGRTAPHPPPADHKLLRSPSSSSPCCWSGLRAPAILSDRCDVLNAIMAAVSIIMNVRNGAATLRAAVESALGQTVQDWEMIVWDDCSTDDSAKTVANFGDPRIRYFLAPQPTSLGKARNAAMQHAQGEWLAFLDQDDIWLPHKLEEQLAIASDPMVALIYGRTLCFQENGTEFDDDYFHEFTSLPE